ncbi:MAG: acylphosphatase [Porticoccaceae bacterium]|nr:acylphosphatase [Porticoccaceae bacterium]
MIAVKGIVDGKVQRVWFRRYVQSVAEPLGLAGYARNLSDGRVEVLLVGAEEAVTQGKLAVAQGSPRSRVTAVTWVEVACPESNQGFDVI